MEQEKTVIDRFADGNLDLPTSFWLFGVVGLTVVGFAAGFFSELIGRWVMVPGVLISAAIVICLAGNAEKYVTAKEKKKESAVWGYLTYVYCALNGLGLVYWAYLFFTGQV
jgi:LytS/YehU family sensor histidine kinase